MTEAPLLPSNSTPWESAVGLTSAARRPLDADIIRRVWDPALCPAHILSALAGAFGVDIWNPNWPEHKQRSVIAGAIERHRLKGTLAGLEAYAALVDSEVVRAITPPGTFILSGGMSVAERDRLALVMPQIRIYRQSRRSKSGLRLYLTAGRYSCLGRRAIADSKAATRANPLVVFAEGGVERPIAVEQVVSILPGVGRALHERALLRRPRRAGVTYLGQIPRFLVTLDPTRSLAAFRRVAGAPTSTIRFGLKPASVDPELFYARGKLGRAFVAGLPLRRRFLGGLNSEARVYERIIIWDPDLVPRRRAASYLGVSRFGIAPYEAELVVHIPSKRPARSLTVGPRGFFGGFFVASTGERLRETFRALRAAKAVRDRILVNTTTFRSPKAGSLIVAGTPFVAGRLLRS